MQDAISENLPAGAFPSHSTETLKRNSSGKLWYQINIENKDIKASLFEYCRKDDPPFLAIVFYASKHGADEERVEKLREKYQQFLLQEDNL